MPQDKKSFDELKRLLRENGFKDDEMPDAIRALVSDPQVGPKIRESYDLSQPRKTLPPEGNWLQRLIGTSGTGGMADRPATALHGMAQAIQHPIKTLEKQTEATEAQLKHESEISAGQGIKEAGKALVPKMDLPAITKDIGKKDYASATGRAITQGIGVGAIASPMLRGAEAEESALAQFKNATDIVAAPLSRTLDAQIAGIDKAMQGQMVNVQNLRTSIAKAAGKLTQLETAPGTKPGDFTAAKNAVEELAERSKKGLLPWSDLRDSVKKIKQASQNIKDPSTKGLIKQVTEGADTELSGSAKKAGQGAVYDKWVKDYADFSDWKRRYTNVLKQKTEAQMGTKATAKTAPSLRVAGTTPIRFGRTRAGKIASQNTKLVKQAHSALDELTQRVKTPPKSAPTPATPGATPPATPPAAPAGPAAQPAAPAAPAAPAPGPAAPAPPPVSGGSPAATPKPGQGIWASRKPMPAVPSQLPRVLGPEGETAMKEAERLGIKPFNQE